MKVEQSRIGQRFPDLYTQHVVRSDPTFSVGGVNSALFATICHIPFHLLSLHNDHVDIICDFS